MKYLLIFLSLIIVNTANAGTVAFQISASSSYSDEGTVISFVFKNLGNDNANNFTAKIIQGDKVFSTEVIEAIIPNREYKIELKIGSDKYKEVGGYNETVYLNYIDGAGYKYNIPSIFKVVNQNESPVKISLSSEVLDFSTSNFAEITIRNSDSREKSINLSVANPMSFKLSFPDIANNTLKLAANESKKIKIEVKARPELPNAWQSFIIADYSEESFHYSSVGTLTINSAKENKITDIYKRENIYAALIALGVLNLLFFLYKRFKIT